MTERRLFSLVLPWLLVVAVGFAVAWVRYGFIQPPEVAHLCDNVDKPVWCGLREAIVIGFNSYAYGIAALVVTALALILRSPWLAAGAAMLGLLALILYCYFPGAAALLIGSLRLVRLQAEEAQR